MSSSAFLRPPRVPGRRTTRTALRAVRSDACARRTEAAGRAIRRRRGRLRQRALVHGIRLDRFAQVQVGVAHGCQRVDRDFRVGRNRLERRDGLLHVAACRATVRSPASAVLTGVYSGVAGIRLSRSSAARSVVDPVEAVGRHRARLVAAAAHLLANRQFFQLRDVDGGERIGPCLRFVECLDRAAAREAEHVVAHGLDVGGADSAPGHSALRRRPAIAVSARRAAGRRRLRVRRRGRRRRASPASGERRGRVRHRGAGYLRGLRRRKRRHGGALVRSSAGVRRRCDRRRRGCGRVGTPSRRQASVLRADGRSRPAQAASALSMSVRPVPACSPSPANAHPARRARWRRLRFHPRPWSARSAAAGRCLRDLHRRIRRPRDRRRLMRGRGDLGLGNLDRHDHRLPAARHRIRGAVGPGEFVDAARFRIAVGGSRGRTQRAATPAAHAGGPVGRATVVHCFPIVVHEVSSIDTIVGCPCDDARRRRSRGRGCDGPDAHSRLRIA